MKQQFTLSAALSLCCQEVTCVSSYKAQVRNNEIKTYHPDHGSQPEVQANALRVWQADKSRPRHPLKMAWGLFSLSLTLFLFPTDSRQLQSPLPTLSAFPIADAHAKIPAPESAGISWTLSPVSAADPEPQRTVTESCDALLPSAWVTAPWFLARYSVRRHMGEVKG